MLAFSVFLGWVFLARLCFAFINRWIKPRSFEEALCDKEHPYITPLDQPVIDYGRKPRRKPQQYLTERRRVFGRVAAEWQQDFFHGKPDKDLKFETEPKIRPIREGAATIVTAFYPNPNRKGISKTPEEFYRRLQRLADTEEQVVIYTFRSAYDKIRRMRNDKHWHVIAKYSSIWQIPNNTFQRKNFTTTQPAIFARMLATGTDAWKPEAQFNQPFLSACYNAKAFAIYDAVLRNPFGSDKWVYMDAGLLSPNNNPPTYHGEPWDVLAGPFLDATKLARSIRLTGDSGVALPEYPEHAGTDVRSRAFSDPAYQWQANFYWSNLIVGSALGMLNFAVRYMHTVDVLDANGRYTAREEYVIPIVAAMYPNTVFSVPCAGQPELGRFDEWRLMLLSYATPFGRDVFPAVRDPIAGRYCGAHTRYRPRGVLEAGKP